MCNSDRNQDFLFLVFTETNEHIRATDEKSVLMVGSFIALIGVLAALVFGEDVVKWQYFILSVFILIVGHCVYMLQSWYRKWKEHYLSTLDIFSG